MLIDFHTHCFPKKIAPDAIKKLSYCSGGLIPNHDGTSQGLKKVMQECDVDISVVLHIATNEKQQTSVNDFAKQIDGDKLISFGSVCPTADNALFELERIKSMGLKGVKLHPEYQNFFVDDEFMKPIYKKISELSLTVLFHAGRDLGYKEPFHGMPEAFSRAIKWLDTDVILAHWGGAFAGVEVIKHLCGLPVIFDTSYGYGAMPKDIAERIIEKHGVDKIVFGSDMPWHLPSWEKRMLETLSLSSDDLDKIYYKNAKRILKLK